MSMIIHLHINNVNIHIENNDIKINNYWNLGDILLLRGRLSLAQAEDYNVDKAEQGGT